MDSDRFGGVSRRTLLGGTIGLGAALAAGPAAAAPEGVGGTGTYPFQNPRLPLKQRLGDLLGRLTLDEKISLLHQYQPPIPRLGMGLVKNGTEALHGLAWSNDFNANGDQAYATATVFPQSVGLGQTWDPELLRQVGTAVGVEARGYHSIDPVVWGLNLWAPVVNLLRDPRWGRNEEGYSEDPYLTGVLSTAYGRGIQGPDPDHLLAAPTLKHLLAYNNEAQRATSSSGLRPRVLREYDEQAFRPAIAADAATGVMTSYNLVNGRPMTVSDLITSTVRGWTGRELMVVSDAFAPANLTGSQHYFATASQAYGAAVTAQMDSFTQDGTNPSSTVTNIAAALRQGLITEAEIDTNVRHILSVRLRLGDFDPGGGRYAGITADALNTTDHQRLARQAGRAQAVLLKNDRNLLPLAKRATVAVIGPLADQIFTDFYAGHMPYRVTPVQGLGEALAAGGGTMRTALGVDLVAFRAPGGGYVTASSSPEGAPLRATSDAVGPDETYDLFDWGQDVFSVRARANNRYWTKGSGNTVVNAAVEPFSFSPQEPVRFVAQADGTVAIRLGTGTNNYVVVDATTAALSATSNAAGATHLTQVTVRGGIDAAVEAATAADAAVVIVGNDPLINGRETQDRPDLELAPGQQALIEAVLDANPHTVLVLESSYPYAIGWAQHNVPAILHTAHAGQETGHALADVLFGDYAPAGRLSQTWYEGIGDLPSIFDYDIIKGGRTYLYYRGTPLYPFGHGLTYTTFSYGNLRLHRHGPRDDVRVTVRVEVTNTGRRDSDEVVQLYTHQRASRVTQPIRQLRGFRRVHVKRGHTATVEFELPVADFALWDVTREKWTVESGTHDVLVGRSSADIRLTTRLRVPGEAIPPRNLSIATRAANFDDYSGIALVDESKAAGDAVGLTHTNDWIKFADADLGVPGTTTINVTVAKAGSDPAAISVVLDDPLAGPVLGTIAVTDTGDRYAYRNLTGTLTPNSGQHDVYLVFTGSLNLASFSLT
jgi:beta-glucosidase